MKELIIQDYKNDSVDFPDRLKFQTDKVVLPTHSIVYSFQMLAAIEEVIEKFNEINIEVHYKDFDTLNFHKDFLLFYLHSLDIAVPNIHRDMDKVARESVEFIGIQILGNLNHLKINKHAETIDDVFEELALCIKLMLFEQRISIEKIDFGYLNIVTVLYMFLRLIGKINFIKKEERSSNFKQDINNHKHHFDDITGV